MLYTLKKIKKFKAQKHPSNSGLINIFKDQSAIHKTKLKNVSQLVVSCSRFEDGM